MDSQQETVALREPVHPGAIVLDYLDFHEWSQSDLARRAGLTAKTVSEICNLKASISPITALAFERVFQRPAHFWLSLQRRFDEALARRDDMANVAEWEDWVGSFPIREMRKLKYALPVRRSDADALLSFFGVSSPKSWGSVWKASAVAYRQTRRFKTSEHAIAAWVREAELVAQEVAVADFNEDRLRSCLPDLRSLTRKAADKIIDPIQELCAAAGVAVVWVPELRNTGISGCARWLSDKRALVGLTLRYKTDDQLWFTFFHEIGHLLLHRGKRSFVVDNAEEDLGDRVVDPEMQQFEAEASRFAADTLIPPQPLSQFIREGEFTNESIHAFADAMSIGPGVVVGRLQHDEVLAPHQGNSLKQKLDWNFVEEGKAP